ncbi:MAG TPA: hypothetical protein VE871_10410 [Longimicrobium sp.]|nr:hypothetical protein [Longimicrobium sp.]
MERFPEPVRTLAYWRRDFERILHPRDRVPWVECACCGVPAYRKGVGCDLCGADGDEPMPSMRAHVEEHGTVHTPEEMAAWGELPPDEEERALVRAIMQLCDFVPGRDEPRNEFWEQFITLFESLEAVRARRLDASQRAFPARYQDDPA